MLKYAVLSIVCLGSVLSAYLSSCVNIALPNIMAALNFNMDSIVWVSLCYLLPYGSTLPLTGRLGDLFGAKNVYLVGMIIFTVASLLCGMANSATAMILFRILQGLGAGMLLPNAMAIVAATFSADERGQALGIWGAMAAAGSAMGPTLGGYLIENFDWRAIFFSVVPICIIGVVLAITIIPSFDRKNNVKIDYLGGVLLVTSISSLLVALNQGQKEGWESLFIVSLFYLAFATFTLFLVVELKVENPMIELGFFRDINFSMANMIAFVSFSAMYADMFLLPFFLKSIMDYSSTTAGIMLLPQSVLVILFSPLGGRMADKYGSRIPLLIGMMMIGYGCYLFHTINADYSTLDFLSRFAFIGAGIGLTMSPSSICAISTLPPDKIGVGSGVFNLAKIVGGSIGVVFAETILTRREIYHAAVLKEYLNGAAHSAQDIFRLLRALWGNQGMSSSALSEAAHSWLTGNGLLPSQYAAFKEILGKLISRQAAILSFQDVFYAFGMICLLGSLLALFIRRETAVPDISQDYVETELDNK